MTLLALYLFGQPRVVLNGTQIHIGRRKSTALLTYLAVTNRSHSRDALAALFWPEYNQTDALAYLRRVLSDLKKSLSKTGLVIDRETASLNQTSLWLDVTEFRQHLAVYKSHNHQAKKSCEDCISHMTEAVKLYRDDFLEGFTLNDSAPFDEWQLFQAENLRRELSAVLERLVHWFLNHQAYETASPYAQRWLEMDPLHEPAHVSLMMLYSNSGQKSSAVRQYQLCAKILSEELGISPSKETTALFERIRASSNMRSIQKLVTISPDHPLSVEHTIPNNLPAQLTSFIGREKEILEVRTMLLRDDIRFLTLTGPGGTGKTRLSLAVAEHVLRSFPDGVFFISLASLRDPALVLDEIAKAFGLQNAGDMTLSDIIEINLRDKKLLLVLDNFEQVLQAAPELTALLTTLPQLNVLVTSRSLLRVTGENTYSVLPLNIPDAETTFNLLTQNEAVKLFTDRTTAVKPNFTLTDKNIDVVVDICKRLDGLPLAIELAAVRTRLLPLQGLLSQLENRLSFLKGGAQDLPARQRTLCSTIEWSHNLLGKEEQVLFRRLSVFAGGCTWQAAEAVCNADGVADFQSVQCRDVLTSLERLVDQSLLQQTEVNGTARFTMLKTIREYALEQLTRSDEAECLQQAHALFFLDLAEKAEPQLDGPEPALWLKRLDIELNNLRAALAWAMESNIAVGLRLASVSACFWIFQARLSEGRVWLEKALTQSESVENEYKALRGRALSTACEMAWCQGDSKKGITLGEQSVEIFRQLSDRRGLAYALRSLGQTTLSFPDSTVTIPLLEESISIYRSLNDKIGLAKALVYYCWKLIHGDEFSRAHSTAEECRQLAQQYGSVNTLAAAYFMLGNVNGHEGNNTLALSNYEKSGSLFRQSGNKLFEPMIIDSIGWARFFLGQYDRAKEQMQRSLALYMAMGNSANAAGSTVFLATIAWHQGNLSEVKAHCVESLLLSRETEIHDFNVARSLLELARVTDIEQYPKRVATLIGCAEKFRIKTSVDPLNLRLEIDRIIDKLHTHINNEVFTTTYTRGFEMTREEAIAFALADEVLE